MLVSSRSFKGKCPICDAANCSCGGPSKVIAIGSGTERSAAGPLKAYPIGRGVSIMLNDEHAEALGLLKEKQAQPALNKMRKPVANKGAK